MSEQAIRKKPVRRAGKAGHGVTMTMLRGLDHLARGGDWRGVSLQVRLDLLARGLVERLAARKGVTAVGLTDRGRRCRDDLRGITGRAVAAGLKPGAADPGVAAAPPVAVAQPELAFRKVNGAKVSLFGDDQGTAEARRHHDVEAVDTLVGEGRDRRLQRVARTVDALGEMRRADLIDGDMLAAGRRFQATFDRAQLDPLRAASVMRIGTGGGDRDLPDRAEEARRQIDRTLRLMGGARALTSLALYHVVGGRMSFSDFARRSGGWGGPSIDRKKAQGLTIGALTALAMMQRESRDRTVADPEAWIILHRYEAGFISRVAVLQAIGKVGDPVIRERLMEGLRSADAQRRNARC